MAGFGFIKEGAKKAGKKMYGYGQQASKGAGQFIEKHPVMAAGGIAGGTYALGQTDMWQNPENIEHGAINKWLEKPWDDKSPGEAFQVYKRYMEIFDNRKPNATKEEIEAFSKEVETAITNKPNTPEKYKKDLYAAFSDWHKSQKG